MRAEFLYNLRVRADAIAETWEAQADPGAMGFRAAVPLQAILADLARRRRGDGAGASMRIPACPCGRNEQVARFEAGEQALTHTVLRLQAELPLAARRASDVDEVVAAARRIGRAAVDACCANCAHRQIDPKCRFR